MKLWDITLKLILCCRGYGAVHKFSFSSSFIFFYHVLCLCLQSKPVSNYIVCLSVCEQHWIWWQFADDMRTGSSSDDRPYGILVYHIIHEQPLILAICNLWSEVMSLAWFMWPRLETTQKRCSLSGAAQLSTDIIALIPASGRLRAARGEPLISHQIFTQI